MLQFSSPREIKKGHGDALETWWVGQIGQEKTNDEVGFDLRGHSEAKTASKNLLEKIRSFYEIAIF